jgi:hypothetical protein
MTYTTHEGKEEGALMTCPTWLWISDHKQTAMVETVAGVTKSTAYREDIKQTYIEGNKNPVYARTPTSLEH